MSLLGLTFTCMVTMYSEGVLGGLVSVIRRFSLQIGVGLLLRIGWMIIAARPPSLEWADPWQYLQRARLTTDGRWGVAPAWPYGTGGPTSFLSVGYPSVVGGVARVTRLGPWHVALGLNLIASLVLIIGVGVLAGRLSGWRAAAGAAWFVVFFPDLITATSIVMTELVAAAIIVSLALAVTRSAPVWWHTAVLVAAVVWIRPSLQLLLIAVPLVLWRCAGLRLAGKVVGLSALLMFPLFWHSTVRVGGGAGFTTATWVNICEGAAADPATPRGEFGASSRCMSDGSGEAAWAEGAKAVAVDAIGDNPLRWIGLTPFRLWHSFEAGGWGIQVAQEWGHNLGPGRGPTIAFRVSQIGFIAVFVAGVLGVFRLRSNRQLHVLLLFAAVSLSGALITFGQPRFSLPTVLLALIPAAAARLTSGVAGGKALQEIPP